MTPEERAEDLGVEVDMLLPEGMVCSDCVYLETHCLKLFGCDRMMRGITLSCGCRVQLILSGLPKDVGSLSNVIIDGTMIQTLLRPRSIEEGGEVAMTKICPACKKTELKPGQFICDACLETHIELLLSQFEPGMKLIKEGRCPRGYTAPIACWFCPTGHATECHHPQTRDQAQCSHYMREMPEEL